MPEFLHLFPTQITPELIKSTFEPIIDFSTHFERNWIDIVFNTNEATFEILAIDSSSQQKPLPLEGLFYVIRALGIYGSKRYRDLVANIDISPNTAEEPYLLSRKREWLEHRVAMNAIDDGFSGCILLDGSIYGREVHLLVETSFSNDRDFMIEYFRTFIKFMNVCRERRILLIGLSKESRSSFFREFLLLNSALEMENALGLDKAQIIEIFSEILDHKYKTLKKVGSIKNEKLKGLMKELLSRKPDFALILRYAQKTGYTVPLLLGASTRWKRDVNQILSDPRRFLISKFPICSQNEVFINNAIEVVTKIPEMPAIVSFHVLPSLKDTPIRVDIPAWCFGLETKLLDVGWPEKVNVDVDKVMGIISAGYCGPENYNLWLKAAHDGVKLSLDVFESLYLRKIMDISGSYKTVRRGRYGRI
jgi:hypothetical protein